MKQCLLCPKLISSRHKLCYPCFRQFRDQMHEPWFLALVELQKVQDKIDSREQFTIDSRANANLYGEVIETPVKVGKKANGRPLTDWTTTNKVLELFDNSIESEKFSNGKRLSLRAISKILNERISFFTVRRILLQYRRDIFLENC